MSIKIETYCWKLCYENYLVKLTCCFVLCCRMSRIACMTAISVMFCCMGLEESEMRLGILLRKWLRKYANSLARSSVLMLQKVRYIGSDFFAICTPQSRELIIYTTYLDFWTLGILIRHFVLYDSYSKRVFSWTALFDCSLSLRHCVFSEVWSVLFCII